jgi:hypothetical protein
MFLPNIHFPIDVNLFLVSLVDGGLFRVKAFVVPIKE